MSRAYFLVSFGPNFSIKKCPHIANADYYRIYCETYFVLQCTMMSTNLIFTRANRKNFRMSEKPRKRLFLMIFFTFQHTKPNDFNISPADQQDQDLVLTTEQQKELFGKDDGVSSLATITSTFRRPNNFGLSLKGLHFKSPVCIVWDATQNWVVKQFSLGRELAQKPFRKLLSCKCMLKNTFGKAFFNLQSCRGQ